jgi:Calx-beta domain/RTX calcium-binding nonapeptide repeat (4 copies)
MRRVALVVGALVLTSAVVASVEAGTQVANKKIVGTARSDVLKGTAKADVINGKAGNDKLYGYAGNDVLIGGAGKDTYSCGAGKDAVKADAKDVRPGKDCEVVTGLPKPAISIADASATEGNSGSTTLSFPVTLSFAATQAVSVKFATADGTAVGPGDFQAASGTLSFKPGEKSKTIDVAVVGETLYEQDETLTVTLSSPVNATIADGSATGSVKNDDTIAQPGHYKGTTSQNELFEFDVTSDGANISGLRTGQINESCVPPTITLAGGNLDFGSRAFPIAPDGALNINVTLFGTVAGFPLKAVITIAGRFSGPAASGTFLEVDTFALAGINFTCTSNNQTWNVTRAG